MARTWFITGASRGLGVEIAKAALRAGDNVVATGRKHADLKASLGTQSGALLTLEQDVTNTEQALSTAAAAVERFGSIAVLANAGYGTWASRKPPKRPG
jgi:NAD(P)-dependent dehydrogenase (short-subunit alcohol dehydrogenase family)